MVLCDCLGVPVIRESERGVEEQVDSLERWLRPVEAPWGRDCLRREQFRISEALYEETLRVVGE